jgi:hypothetical protein
MAHTATRPACNRCSTDFAFDGDIDAASRPFLETELAKTHDGPTVVVTHFSAVLIWLLFGRKLRGYDMPRYSISKVREQETVVFREVPA